MVNKSGLGHIVEQVFFEVDCSFVVHKGPYHIPLLSRFAMDLTHHGGLRKRRPDNNFPPRDFSVLVSCGQATGSASRKGDRQLSRLPRTSKTEVA